MKVRGSLEGEYQRVDMWDESQKGVAYVAEEPGKKKGRLKAC